uniref:Transposable element Tc1 transposase n=1 Tax=Bactrocera latifrons TaxID=174628 RepID=A0A0K8WKL3_BACLA
MSSAGVGNLAFIDSTMDKTMYLNILKANLLQSASKLNIREGFRFYQDNDPKHKPGVVQSCLIWNCPHVVQRAAQSPDLNAIENLWLVLEREIRKYEIRIQADLKTAVEAE